ncbi:MAG: beta-propeller domain-containing protein [Granulosicoccus sp.]|nr:beta-propeller domain-containing protein [Granulosicoccus sp.]
MTYRTPLQGRPFPLLLGLTAVMLLSACSENSTQPNNVLTDPDDRFRGLQVIGDKEIFADSIRTALLSHHRADTQFQSEQLALPTTDALAPTANTDGAVAESNQSTTASTDGFGTNVQEVGVDEADRVKSDGEFLYVLTPDQPNYGGPIILEDTRDSALYVPPSTSQIRVLSLDHEAADASLVSTVDIEGGAGHTDGLYLHGSDSDKSLIITSSSMDSYWGFWYDSAQFHGQQSTIQKLDIDNPANVTLADTLTLDGHIVSSRRVGDYLYLATRYYPRISGVQPYVTDTATATDIINSTDIDEVLPKIERQSDGKSESLADVDRCFVAQKPESGYYSPDIITLAVVDIKTFSITDSVCYLGSTETFYASTNSAYLATTDYYRGGAIPVDGGIAVLVDSDEPSEVDPETPDEEPGISLPEPERNPTVTTEIHQFDFAGGALRYVGSGSVEGHLGWNLSQKPFRMSEKDGYLRVATYNATQNSKESPVLLSVLKPGDNRTLDTIARLPNENSPGHIGKPGEQLHASRFLGDKAYLVTFLQTDPLYVVDLSDPANPKVAGELEIEGYSDYLHPIDDNYLLGIGKGAVPAGGASGGWRGAFAQGVKLSLFDISNPASPREVNSIEIGKRGSHSGALADHHGIRVVPATDEHPTRVAISIDVNDIPNTYSQGPGGWYDWRETGLFGFEIQTGANAGISRQGQMIVERRSDEQPWGPTRYEDRSVLIKDAVFYIHGEQVYGANWNSMSNINGPR